MRSQINRIQILALFLLLPSLGSHAADSGSFRFDDDSDPSLIINRNDKNNTSPRGIRKKAVACLSSLAHEASTTKFRTKTEIELDNVLQDLEKKITGLKDYTFEEFRTAFFSSNRHLAKTQPHLVKSFISSGLKLFPRAGLFATYGGLIIGSGMAFYYASQLLFPGAPQEVRTVIGFSGSVISGLLTTPLGYALQRRYYAYLDQFVHILWMPHETDSWSRIQAALHEKTRFVQDHVAKQLYKCIPDWEKAGGLIKQSKFDDAGRYLGNTIADMQGLFGGLLYFDAAMIRNFRLRIDVTKLTSDEKASIIAAAHRYLVNLSAEDFDPQVDRRYLAQIGVNVLLRWLIKSDPQSSSDPSPRS